MDHLDFTAYDNNPRPWRGAGTIDFSGREISLGKMADGALFRLRYRIRLNSEVRVSISHITGEIGIAKYQLPALALGVAIDPQCHVVHTGYKPLSTDPQLTLTGSLQLPVSLAALEAIERFRVGGPLEFTVVLQGCALVGNDETDSFEVCRLQVNGSSSEPVRIHADRDVWIQQLRQVSPMGSVLVDIPLASDRGPPWDKVWKQLENAAANLRLGGEMGWKNCVTEVRQALDAWKAIEGFKGASQADRKKDKRQRLHDAAASLLHYCSLSVHPDEHQEEWTRADAIMALSTLCALLSARDP